MFFLTHAVILYVDSDDSAKPGVDITLTTDPGVNTIVKGLHRRFTDLNGLIWMRMFLLKVYIILSRLK
jgi:hypothetical protein